MIYPSLNRIADELNSSMYEKWGPTINGTNEIVQLGNIANINDEKNELYNKIILTLLKVEEENALKNAGFYSKKPSNQIEKHHPAVYLNLYLLVAVTKKDYREALQLLSDTITFFQAKKVFTGYLEGAADDENPSFRISIELQDINFQEYFDMWSNLGSRQFPSVIYKIRLLKMFDAKQVEEVPYIKTVNIQQDIIDQR
jgi:hypothetical protein